MVLLGSRTSQFPWWMFGLSIDKLQWRNSLLKHLCVLIGWCKWTQCGGQSGPPGELRMRHCECQPRLGAWIQQREMKVLGFSVFLWAQNQFPSIISAINVNAVPVQDTLRTIKNSACSRAKIINVVFHSEMWNVLAVVCSGTPKSIKRFKFPILENQFCGH